MGERQAHRGHTLDPRRIREGHQLVTLSVPGDSRKIPTRTFAFPSETTAASNWFSGFFEQPITVRYSPEGLPDDNIANGPTIVSSATLQAVCDLFDGMEVDETRQRFRTTLEIDGVPPSGKTNSSARKNAALCAFASAK